jgi:hypothetical protein
VIPTDDERPGQPRYSQTNAPSSGGTVYANQGGNQMIHSNTTLVPPARQRLRPDSVALLVMLVADVAFLVYGIFSVSSKDVGAAGWQSAIFVIMLLVTGILVRRWLRRRL